MGNFAACPTVDLLGVCGDHATIWHLMSYFHAVLNAAGSHTAADRPAHCFQRMHTLRAEPLLVAALQLCRTAVIVVLVLLPLLIVHFGGLTHDCVISVCVNYSWIVQVSHRAE